jgi:hypothetical protein
MCQHAPAQVAAAEELDAERKSKFVALKLTARGERPEEEDTGSHVAHNMGTDSVADVTQSKDPATTAVTAVTAVTPQAAPATANTLSTPNPVPWIWFSRASASSTDGRPSHPSGHPSLPPTAHADPHRGTGGDAGTCSRAGAGSTMLLHSEPSPAHPYRAPDAETPEAALARAYFSMPHTLRYVCDDSPATGLMSSSLSGHDSGLMSNSLSTRHEGLMSSSLSGGEEEERIIEGAGEGGALEGGGWEERKGGRTPGSQVAGLVSSLNFTPFRNGLGAGKP